MDNAIIEIIKEYRNNLEKAGIKVKEIILFGSYASGNYKEESDIDLVVISDDFKEMDLLDRLGILGLAKKGIRNRKPMEILGYSEEEYNAKESGSFIYDEVKTKGIKVA